MKPIILAAACASLAGCIEPPPPSELTTRSILTGTDGCPTAVETVDINRNNKISWSLDTTGAGFPGIEAFSIIFEDDNPTYCVNDSTVAKNESITCTIRVDAKPEPVCYTLVTRSNGGAQFCERRFLMRVGNQLEHHCGDH